MASSVQMYCRCYRCEQFFPVAKRRKFCKKSCRDSNYYLRKSMND